MEVGRVSHEIQVGFVAISSLSWPYPFLKMLILIDFQLLLAGSQGVGTSADHWGRSLGIILLDAHQIAFESGCCCTVGN